MKALKVQYIFQQTYWLLSPSQRKQGLWLSIGLLLMALLDLFSLVTIFPATLAFLNPDFINNNEWTQNIYNWLGFSQFDTFLLFTIIGVLILFSSKSIYGFAIISLKARYINKVAEELSVRMFERFFSTGFLNKLSSRTGNELHKMVNLPDTFAYKVLQSILDLLPNIVICTLVILGLVIFQSKIFFYLVIVLLIPLLFFFYFVRLKTKRIRTDLQKNYPTYLGKSVEMINGYIDIVVSNNLGFFKDKFAKYSSRIHDNLRDLSIQVSIVPKFTELIIILGICSLFLFFYFNDTNPSQSLLVLTLFAVAAFKLAPSINQLINAYSNISMNGYAIDDLETLVNNKIEVVPPGKKSLTFEKEICLQNITFSYDDSTFGLQDINLRILKNQKLAIVGKSGSGKSTLIHVLLNLLEQSSGKITVDGIEISKTNISAWYNLISYIPPNPFIMEGTIIENVVMGNNLNKESEIEEIKNILLSLELQDLIEQSPLGVHQTLGENGKGISSGQKQRLAIARAIFADKPIMIFDEVTSNLDPHSEEQVLGALNQAYVLKKTLIFITHHPQVIQHCDEIIQFENGELITKKKNEYQR